MILQQPIQRGDTHRAIPVDIQDLSLLNGAGKTGLAYNTAGITVTYFRELDNQARSIALATTTLGAWASGGFIVIDATNQPGKYLLYLPDAVISASDASQWVRVEFLFTSAVGAYAPIIQIPLVAYAPQVATNLGLSALPTASAGANSGLPLLDSNLSVAANLKYILGTLLSESIVGNLANAFKQWLNVTTPTGTVNDSTTILARIGAFTGTGVNTVLGFLRAMSRSDLAAPSDMGGTYSPATDSLQAIEESIGSIPVGDPLSNPVPGSYPAGTAGYDIGLLPGINARAQAGNFAITDGFSSTGQVLTIVRFETYGGSGVPLQLSISVPIDPTGATIYWSLLQNNLLTQFPGTLVSYDALTGIAVFSLALGAAESGDLSVIDGNFALSAVLGSTNVLQGVPYTNGKLVIKDAPRMPLA